MRFAWPLLALTLGAPATAQRLAYEDVLTPPPRQLAYAPVDVVDEDEVVLAFYGDRLELLDDGETYGWDVSAELGRGAHRLWLSSAGDGVIGGGLDYVEVQALYSHPVSESGLALQAGVRRDFVRPHRTYAVLGVQGNVTDPLYVGAFGFLSTQGELSGRLFAYYDWEPVPRLVFQPYGGVELAASDMPALAVGRGLSEMELGLRLRYRIAEPFSPYLGVRYDRLLGRTARIARQAGEDVGGTSLVLGLRSYF
jgi:copper resistance protein B